MLSYLAMAAVVYPVECLHPVECEIELLTPAEDVADPLLSIVVPALNERIAIAEFVQWCKAGLAAAGIRGEILIVDSSTDNTPAIALASGARVLRTPRRGLGRAYIDAIPYIRGKYVLMGDADCTYDFRELSGFVRQFRAGYEFIMGSRFRGVIEPHSMPALHRYFGTPLTTAILNILYSTGFSDIHCGMRGITRDALVRLDLKSQSWEYASEMVLKAVCLKLKTAEVPVHFLKDPAGRLSHMKRNGWLEPWRAGWINLRAMLLFGADFFLLRPGLVLLALGLLITVPVSLGPLPLGPVTLSLNWMMLGLTLSVVGLQCFYLGCIVQVMYRYSPARAERWLRLFSYDRAMLASGLAGLAGCALGVPLIREYVAGGLRLPSMPTPQMHLAVLGLLFLIAGFYTFSCTLVLHAAGRAEPLVRAAPPRPASVKL
ncbi:MAG TPA: glycosyltransferase family 2 protein [Bryobacteraceae bacterium]|nr:glycosyltransferase family 2 protein [Bryobacteraceae bacterium]